MAFVPYPADYYLLPITAVAAASRDASTLPAACLSNGRCGPQAAVAVTDGNFEILLEWTAISGNPMLSTPVAEVLPRSRIMAMNRSGTWLPPEKSNGTDLFGDGYPNNTFSALFNASPVSVQFPLNFNLSSALSADLNGDGLSDFIATDFNGNLLV